MEQQRKVKSWGTDKNVKVSISILATFPEGFKPNKSLLSRKHNLLARNAFLAIKKQLERRRLPSSAKCAYSKFSRTIFRSIKWPASISVTAKVVRSKTDVPNKASTVVNKPGAESWKPLVSLISCLLAIAYDCRRFLIKVLVWFLLISDFVLVYGSMKLMYWL